MHQIAGFISSAATILLEDQSCKRGALTQLENTRYFLYQWKKQATEWRRTQGRSEQMTENRTDNSPTK